MKNPLSNLIYRAKGLKPWPHACKGPKPEPVFAIDGETYYRIPKAYAGSAIRTFVAMEKYREINQNLQSEDLETLFKALTVELNKGDLMGACIKLHETKARAKRLTRVGIMLELAAVVFFDAIEDPNNYGPTYAETKISIWERALREGKLPPFFLEQPFSAFLPVEDPEKIEPQALAEILADSLEIEREGREMYIKSLTRNLSPEDQAKALRYELHQHRKELGFITY